jgi:CheY-like chemotaxis protein
MRSRKPTLSPSYSASPPNCNPGKRTPSPLRTVNANFAMKPAAVSSTKLPDGDYVQLEVSDTGGGMSAETRTRLFDPFFTTKSGGRGLGLAVVDGIVRGLRGTIHVVGDPGKGTTFQILLPAVETTPGVTGEPISGAVESERASPEFTVLVVEDEDPLRQAVVRMLRRAGFEVLEAANGTVATDILRVHGGQIDLILLDMTIPGASSHEVAAVAAQVRPGLKVVSPAPTTKRW